jgi:hypothetical protein
MDLLKLFPPMPRLSQGSLGITIDSASRMRELRESLEASQANIVQTPDGLAIGPFEDRQSSAN